MEAQFRALVNDEHGAENMRLFDFEFLDINDKYGGQYVIVNFKLESLVSKQELLAKMQQSNQQQGGMSSMLGAMVTQMMSMMLPDFTKGDLETVEDEYDRVLRSGCGWILDPF